MKPQYPEIINFPRSSCPNSGSDAFQNQNCRFFSKMSLPQRPSPSQLF
ncbi:Uncharacterized protein dnm_094090 [Desulfonema magnum]|uniref:Uncharacterized protein n=1 Tax=Desulfonema magnum TaxID=45655 RepID=A0A975BXR9_9BACT|nr:Uncharacterized protein dnm_094090 [Desulfonema magnum]